MKKFLLFSIISLSFLSNRLNAQVPPWVWANRAGGAADDYGRNITTDASGNVYVAGSFQSTSITFGATLLVNAGILDMFVVKYDGNGNVIWAKRGGGAGAEEGMGVRVDINGNVYVTGTFNSSTLTFGSTTLINAGSNDMFVVKYDASGNVLWAKSVGGANDEDGKCIAVSPLGVVSVAGTFTSATLTVGATTITNQLAGSADIYLISYNSSGTALWFEDAGGTSSDYVYSMAADVANNIFISGVTFGSSITFNSTTLAGDGFFVAKYHSDGSVAWARNASSSGSNSGGSGICSDADGNAYVTGYFSGASMTVSSTTLTNASISSDIFVVKYDSSGTFKWAEAAGGAGYESGNGIVTDTSGNAYIIGNFTTDTLTMGPSTLVSVNPASEDILVAKYDTGGTVMWATSAGGTDDEFGASICANSSGDLFITGDFRSPSLSFGSTVLANPNTSFYDIFVAKLGGILTSLEENISSREFTVFPNPARNEIEVQNGKFSIRKIEIINMLGESQKISMLNSERGTKVDVSGLSSGIYFLRLVDKNNIITIKKFIISG